MIGVAIAEIISKNLTLLQNNLTFGSLKADVIPSAQDAGLGPLGPCFEPEIFQFPRVWYLNFLIYVYHLMSNGIDD
jgi:hypothetical protein